MTYADSPKTHSQVDIPREHPSPSGKPPWSLGKPSPGEGLPSDPSRHRTTIGTTTATMTVIPPSPTSIGVAAFG